MRQLLIGRRGIRPSALADKSRPWLRLGSGMHDGILFIFDTLGLQPRRILRTLPRIPHSLRMPQTEADKSKMWEEFIVSVRESTTRTSSEMLSFSSSLKTSTVVHNPWQALKFAQSSWLLFCRDFHTKRKLGLARSRKTPRERERRFSRGYFTSARYREPMGKTLIYRGRNDVLRLSSNIVCIELPTEKRRGDKQAPYL